MFFLVIFSLIILCTVFIFLGCQPEKNVYFLSLNIWMKIER
jgi:hypothetical protein